MQTPHPVGPRQGKLESGVACGGVFCFEALCEKKRGGDPNHFLSWSNLTCCDNCSVRNFFDISERDFFSSPQKPELHWKTGFKSHKLIRLFNYSLFLAPACLSLISVETEVRNKPLLSFSRAMFSSLSFCIRHYFVPQRAFVLLRSLWSLSLYFPLNQVKLIFRCYHQVLFGDNLLVFFGKQCCSYP